MVTTDDHLRLTPLPGQADLGIVDALAQLSFAVQSALSRIAMEHDMSLVQARMLGILRDRRPTVKELAALLQVDKSSVTGLVDRAEERGLVHRTPSPVDGRSVQVVITAAGQRQVNGAATDFESEISSLVAQLTPAERTRLSQLATTVVATDATIRGIDIFDVRVEGSTSR
jgi:MarR family transcriptional regulator, lower aerobic nicotinate degradation pathway regulator